MLKFGKRFVVLIAFLTMFVVVFATSGAYSYWAGTVESPAEETKEVIIQAGNWPKPQNHQSNGHLPLMPHLNLEI